MADDDNTVAELLEFQTIGLSIQGEELDAGQGILRIEHNQYGTDRALYLAIPFRRPSALLDRIESQWNPHPPVLRLAFDGPAGAAEYRVTDYRLWPVHGAAVHLLITLDGETAERLGRAMYGHRVRLLGR